MKQPIVTAGLLALGLSLVAVPTVASETQDRFREEGKEMDLTGFFQADTDAYSRSFLFGGVNEHDFSVEQAGTYRFTSDVTAGYSNDYRIAAVLLDSQGREIARSQALGQNGGLQLQTELEPGDYVLRVEGQRFGTRGKAGDAYSIQVAGLDDQGRRIERAVDDGGNIQFVGENRTGGRSVFVRGDDAVATVRASDDAAGNAAAAGATATAAASASSTESEAASSAGQAQQTTGQQQQASEQDGFETIVTDVKIRAKGEVLTFDVAEAGTISIETSTYPAGFEDTYRLTLDVLDESGRVVAEGAGEGFDGDVDMQTVLEPGRYRIRVQGQKFGSAHSGVNNYELKVEQIDRR
ncbi:hypothetical protein [Halomonas caseinilytica]|uniref:Pre-peptidase C-terminal domain-containing protein n=1 Tax=Halomonas caseinilytica TaxID=438744 RepID=A0A1M6RU89_9GAMM|nr:hypothetical protein [Halomonas caseinilytica]SHK35989.1 hypothetical protein SAMN05192556_102413 [Halomonas caseinilytica]